MRKGICLLTFLCSSVALAEDNSVAPIESRSDALAVFVASGHGCLHEGGVSGIGERIEYGGNHFVCTVGRLSSGKRLAGWIPAEPEHEIAEQLSRLNAQLTGESEE